MRKQLHNLRDLNHWCWHNPFNHFIYLCYVTLMMLFYIAFRKQELEKAIRMVEGKND